MHQPLVADAGVVLVIRKSTNRPRFSERVADASADFHIVFAFVLSLFPLFSQR